MKDNAENKDKSELTKFGDEFRHHSMKCMREWLDDYFQEKNGKTIITANEAVTVLIETVNIFFVFLSGLDELEKDTRAKAILFQDLYSEISRSFATIMNDWNEEEKR